MMIANNIRNTIPSMTKTVVFEAITWITSSSWSVKVSPFSPFSPAAKPLVLPSAPTSASVYVDVGSDVDAIAVL